MTEREALRLLHLDEGCSRDQLRRAYLDMVKVWHPDRFQTDPKLRAKAERTLQRINDAYALLLRRGPNWTSAPSRAYAAAPASQPTPTWLTRRLVLAAAAGTAVGVVLALVTGSELLSPRGRGTGQVSARNATSWDAAVLLDGPSGARGFFLRRGEQVTLLDVAPGTYGLRVMFGATWTGRAFARGAAFFQREEPVGIVAQPELAGATAPLIVLERAAMRSVAAFALE